MPVMSIQAVFDGEKFIPLEPVPPTVRVGDSFVVRIRLCPDEPRIVETTGSNSADDQVVRAGAATRGDRW